MLLQYIQYAFNASVRPVLVVIMRHSIGQEGRVGINVGWLVGQNQDCLVDKVVHILFKRNVIKECFFGPVMRELRPLWSMMVMASVNR